MTEEITVYKQYYKNQTALGLADLNNIRTPLTSMFKGYCKDFSQFQSIQTIANGTSTFKPVVRASTKVPSICMPIAYS